MTIINYIFCVLVFSLFLSCCLCIPQSSAADAKGIITVDGTEVQLRYAVARLLFDDIIILITDKPVDKEKVPDEVGRLSGQNKIKGILFSLSKKNKRLLGKGESSQSIYFNTVWDQLGTIGNGELSISEIEGDVIKARIKTPSPNEWNGHTFSYDIEFSVNTKKNPPPVVITGVNDGPTKAFSSYYRFLMAGKKDEFTKYIANESLKEIENNQGMMELFVEIQQETNPTNLDIISSKITKEKAIININGKRGNNRTSGTIEMVKENNEWKILNESWISGEIN